MMQNDPLEDEPYDMESPRPPSKSQLKRDATALQALGENLVKLTTTQLKQIPLPEDLLAAVQVAQSISQRGGRKRQLQLIGKLMRSLEDTDVAAIRAALITLLPSRQMGASVKSRS